MRSLLLASLLTTAGCSAPDVADAPPEPLAAPAAAEPPEELVEVPATTAPDVPPHAAEDAPDPPPAAPPPERPLPADHPDAPDPVGPPEPLAGQPTPTGSLPAPPFQAWTVASPITLVGPGGAKLAVLEAPHTAVTVLQVLPERMSVRCTGCPGDARDVEGWIQLGLVTVEQP